MGTEESNTFVPPYKYLVPQDETSSKPLPPQWATSTQDAAMVCSENVRRIRGKIKLNTMKRCDKNLQRKSSLTQESGENEDRSVTRKDNRDGMSWSATSESKGSPDKGHETNNVFPSTKRQQCDMMLGTADPTEQNQSWGAGHNASGRISKLSKLEQDEIRKERKRQLNRESAKRSRLRKQQECERVRRSMDILKEENSILTQRLIRLSEECLELSNENDAIEEELVRKYGPESIADLLHMKPAA